MANNAFEPLNNITSTLAVGAGVAAAHTFTALQLKQAVFFVTPSEPLATVLHIRTRETGDATAADANDTVIPPNNALPYFRTKDIVSISIFNPGLSAISVIISPVIPRG